MVLGILLALLLMQPPYQAWILAILTRLPARASPVMAALVLRYVTG